MRTSLLATAVLTGALLPALTPGPASALSCVGPDEVIEEAEQVFVGRIVDSADGRLLLAVDEVWKGGPVEERVWMKVDLPGWSEWAGPDGEVPDGYRSTGRWVFAPYDAAVGPCTAWHHTRALARAHSPDQPDAPVPDGSLDGSTEAAAPDAGGPPLLAAAGLGLGGGTALAAAALALLRRRSPRRRSRTPRR